MTSSWRRLSIGAAAAALAAAAAGAALVGPPVAGASGPTAILTPAGTGASRSAALAPKATNSSVAGYRVVNSAGVTSFDATVTVPAITCPPAGTYSGYLSSQVVGTTVSGGTFVHLSCAAGGATYTGFIVFTTVTNGLKFFTVKAGNTIESQITLKATKKGTTTVHTRITDETTGVVTTKWVTYKGTALDTTAWDVFEHVGKASVPPFTTDTWSGAQSNGVSLEAAGATHYNMTETGTLLVSASKLSSTGSSFTNAFHASA